MNLDHISQIARAPKKDKKKADPVELPEDLVEGMQKLAEAKHRISYAMFWGIGQAAGHFDTEKRFVLFVAARALNALPDGLDAIVVNNEGTPPAKHANARCNTEAWPIADADKVVELLKK